MRVRTEDVVPESTRNWGWLFPALWCGLILLASSIPEVTTPAGIFARDKFIHFAEYGVLGAITAVALAELVSWRIHVRVVAAIGVCLAFGALDEAYQISVSGRSADYLDFLADGVGAVVGQTVLLFGRIRKGGS
ncbi:MAG: VanZ family protein [Candidatus Eisenbacteria sp.]|nr:VanZ family protein [Candidatus Eisenbacteria bacterium]